MDHVVFFPAPDGTPAFRRLANLEEAVRLVEHLRNVEGVSSVSVHALTEVPLSFRAYYRVEVPGAATAEVDVPAQPTSEAEQEPPTVAPEAVPALALVEEPAPELAPEQTLVSSNGHATPVSLGFFA